MTAITSLSFSAVNQSSSERNTFVSSLASRNLSFEGFRLRSVFSCHYVGVKASNSTSRTAIHCMSTSTDVPPTVSETKSNFLKAYKRPIPSIYNTVLQELIVQQHLMRIDAKKLEEWARAQTHSSLVDFSSKEGEIEGILKGIAERAASGNFSYSRFFAVGLFRLLELSNASEPTVLEKLCSALNINKRSVDRDLDVYRGLLSKLVQAKELLKEYVDREKKKQEERAESQKANEMVAKCLGDPQVVGQ
ncbi:protein THYLAKOID FORMATION1, chloroplastic isoform X2 [Populus trichocarpa]|uniref:protein THYLAKOID FORMATION1, chloroplastic isoform X2 n=1 Tax=Populus trichocarpa TaxID=3694 RepID=UPI000CCD8DB8|nr:protein THYLAKOID FORMATION1, chloroplastic isoform X2 [Populus trichocarpa]|eukprot:XP_024439054.1 protein THYLAKOID FORMATION1, chloroplastic isoform X2 [Populus trichocarpa]